MTCLYVCTPTITLQPCTLNSNANDVYTLERKNRHYITLVPDSFCKRRNDLSAFFQLGFIHIFSCRSRNGILCSRDFCCNANRPNYGQFEPHYVAGFVTDPESSLTLTIRYLACCKVIKLFVACSQNGILPVCFFLIFM